MLSEREIAAAAASLDEAERTRRQIGLLSLAHPAMTIDDAYAVQAAWVAQKLAAGRRIIGHKIGLTSKAMQAAIGIAEPDSGVLFDDMLFANSGDISADRFIATRIEAELAFVLKHELSGPGCTIEAVLAATGHVAPALEILDTRVLRADPTTKKARTIVDTIADNAANAGIVVGERKIAPGETDLRWIGAIVAKNGELEETGLAAGVLDHPARGIAWLADRLAERGNWRLLPGQIVLSGSFIRPIEVRKGDEIRADFGPFGVVACRFR
jgi:2-oxo-hept-3-ene-1,7-dioate hydratase